LINKYIMKSAGKLESIFFGARKSISPIRFLKLDTIRNNCIK
jgi:hypothetical protein